MRLIEPLPPPPSVAGLLRRQEGGGVRLKLNRTRCGVEQKHLDEFWLFSLPESFRYHFLSTAGSSLGYIHSEETLA